MANNIEQMDALLVGAGIMSATLAALLKEFDASFKVEVIEQRSREAQESSDPWNNAGTGHAGLCELNYTPEAADGSIDNQRAVRINCQFEESKQFWSHLVAKGALGTPRDFINPTPHLSYVSGNKDIRYLRTRYEALTRHHAFAEMVFAEDHATLAKWMPLMMQGRRSDERLAATYAAGGTDVDFGNLTTQLLTYLGKLDGTTIAYNQKVTGLQRKDNGWLVTIKNRLTSESRQVQSRFVFLGAGGGALPLLQMSGIPEGKGFGGFPVGGQWLRCDNPDVIKQHGSKVYSRAAVGAPPMSVPHLDNRVVNGKASLLFGPYACFTTKFLKDGSIFDLPFSVRPDNLWPMLAVARDNTDLTVYLIKEVLQSHAKRLDSLRQFYPTLNPADWRLEIAGQRVQIIKKDAKKGGILQFGTEVVAAADGSIAALLGASPGASVSVSVMIDLIERCFPSRAKAWNNKVADIVPARISALESSAATYNDIRARSDKLLQLI
ncbi:MAG: malate dehydrogenase (quinone) [Oxalobacter sp.]|nr:MAG: malate dehydrogenase (quinone) [Oxalobacter sp.]